MGLDTRLYHIASDYTLQFQLRIKFREEYPGVIFGKNDWEEFFGEVGEEPPLPFGMIQFLEGPCRHNPGKRVLDTHILFLMPRTVNGRPFSLNLIEELIRVPENDERAANIRCYPSGVKEAYGDTQLEESYWVLMTKNLLEGSREKPYEDCLALAREKKGYQSPTVLEAVTGSVLKHVGSGEYILSTNPFAYTFCQEKLSESTGLIVGAFGKTVGGRGVPGLGIYTIQLDCTRQGDRIGIVASRRF